MRATLVLVPLALSAAPAVAQAPAPAEPQAIQIPPQLTDPAVADRLANVMQALSKAFLDLPVGQVEAAVEGRAPTAADKKLTVRDLGRRDNPNFDRDLQRQIAESKPMIEQSMKAMATALPAMMKGLQDAGEAVDRAVQNMPRPDYPKR
jgi:hypothetical protein